MKKRKKLLKFKRNVEIEGKKIVRHLRMFHPVEIINGKTYLKNNEPVIIDVTNEKYLKINVLGKILEEDASKLDFKEIEEFSNSLNFADIDDEIIKSKSGTLIYGHFNNQLVIFQSGTNKLAYISFIPNTTFDDDFKLLKNLVSSAVLLNVDYILVYIKKDKRNGSWKNRDYINRTLGKLGANQIIFSFNEELPAENDIKTYRHDKLTYINKSMERFTNDKGYTSIVHVEVNLSNIKEQYQYYFVVNNEKSKVKYLTLNAGEVITEYNSLYKTLKEKSKLILFEDIFRILEIPFPDKCHGMEKIEIKKICSNVSYVGINDVFFLLEPFHDNNDKNVVSDKFKKKQAESSIDRGALFVFSYVPLSKGSPYFLCENVRESHIKLCSYLHEKNNVITIGITGSVGKTTTKDMLACVLSEKYKVTKSVENGNVQKSIGKNIQKIQPTTEVYIQELGGGRPGGASRHSRMINPDMTMITNIGTAHIGNFGTQEKLMENKLGITEGMKSNGIFFQNLDDDNLKNAKLDNTKIITYSAKNNHADYYASDILLHDNGSEFYINVKGNKNKIKANLNVNGLHNVLNAVVCYAMAAQLELSSEQIISGLKKFKTAGIRQNLTKISGQKVLLDCYNASLDSVKTSLRTLDRLPIKNTGRKIAVIGDLTGVGELEEQVHELIAEEIAKYNFDYVVLHGDLVKVTSDALNKKDIEHKYFPLNQKKKLNLYLKRILKANDIILLKGSSKVELENQVDLLLGTNFTAFRLLSEGDFQAVPGKYNYRLFDDFSILYKYSGRDKNVKIRNTVYGKRNHGVYKRCFENNKYIRNVKFSHNNLYIGKASFKSCINLENIKFSNIKFIGENAFENCKSLTEVILNEGVMHISSRAFYKCKKLETIYIPDSVKQIGINTFKDCPKLKILCHSESYAKEYARKNGLKYKCI